jgi:hypothetical protein
VVTAAPRRRVTNALVALAIAGATSTLGGVAWADPTPEPTAGTTATATATAADEAANSAADATPTVLPSGSTWIEGGTLLEAAKPVIKPAAKPVTRVVSTRTTTRTTTRSSARTSTRTATGSTAASARAAAPDGALALPFTGGHVQALLPTGFAMLLVGVALTFASRPRRVLI